MNEWKFKTWFLPRLDFVSHLLVCYSFFYCICIDTYVTVSFLVVIGWILFENFQNFSPVAYKLSLFRIVFRRRVGCESSREFPFDPHFSNAKAFFFLRNKYSCLVPIIRCLCTGEKREIVTWPDDYIWGGKWKANKSNNVRGSKKFLCE